MSEEKLNEISLRRGNDEDIRYCLGITMERQVTINNLRIMVQKKEHELQQARARIVRLEEVAKHARNVMSLLEEHGPGIVLHLMDTDDNSGQYLREALNNREGGSDG